VPEKNNVSVMIEKRVAIIGTKINNPRDQGRTLTGCYFKWLRPGTGPDSNKAIM
jgi:hypothetical protein